MDARQLFCCSSAKHGEGTVVVKTNRIAKILTLVTSLMLVALPATTSAAPTVVSISFDDGYAEGTQAAAMLEARGMRATYFIISGYIGQNGYLTVDQLRGLQAAGHEIGGHTVTHPHLVALAEDEAHRQ